MEKKRQFSDDSAGADHLQAAKRQALDTEDEVLDVGGGGDVAGLSQSQSQSSSSQEIHKMTGQRLLSWDQLDFSSLPPLNDKQVPALSCPVLSCQDFFHWISPFPVVFFCLVVVAG